VTITGIRKGIEDAISVKKNSDSIVESVSAEDIGKLPDNSIAESIARLPGLSAQRVAGRAQVISVRGLSPDFATTLLNGREMVSTGDNRSVEFDQYPSELLSGVTIYKTPDAGLIGQGLSGTMDMQTVRPLSFSKRVVAVNARLQDNSLGSAANAKSTGNRFSASFIDQSADRSVGFAIGFAHQESPVAEDQVGFYEPWKTDGRAGVPAGTYITDGVKALRRTGVTKRDGLMATLEVKPDKNWTSTLDAFTSKATQEDTANQFEVNLGGWNGGYDPALLYTGVTVNSNGTLAGGVANNVYPLVRGMYNKRDDKIDAIGWNNKFKLIGIAMNVDASYSKATRNELSLENNTQLAPPPQLDALNLNVVQGGFSTLTPGLNYSDPSTLYLRNTIYGSGYGKVPSVEDELKGFKVAGTVAAPAAISNVFADIELGLNYADRSKHKTQPEGNINVGVQGDTTIASDLQYGLVDLGFAGIGKIPSWNVPGAVGRYMTFAPVDNQPWLVSKAWTVEEKITTTFAKANIDTQMGSVPVRGNVGLQIQSVDQSSKANFWDGTAAAGSEVKPVTDGKTSTDVLPSLNLAFNLGRDQTVRLGLAQQVARPKMQDLTSSIDFGVDTTTGKPGGSGGNARLDPWRANAIDISYEKYFGNKGYVSAAAFYKDLKSYIYKQSRDGYDFSQFTVGNPIATTNFGTYTAPFNGQGGRLSGVELAASLPLGMLTSTLNGFGIQASTSITDSNIKIKDPDSASSVGDGNITLPGLSKNVSNLTFYYEAGGFEARVSQRTRSDFIGEIGNFNGNRTLRYVVGESIVDAQIGYNFTEGNMKGLGLLLQVNNLGDTAYQTYAGTKDRPLEYIKYGRTILFGANYKF
jgi:TonB-dependent receptor